MRLPEQFLLLIAALGLSGCTSLASRQAPPSWSTGFWLWHSSTFDAAWSAGPLDALYVHASNIRHDTEPNWVRRTNQPAGRWFANGYLPNELPAAKEYWLVFRYVRQGVPDLQVASMVAGQVRSLRAEARKRHLNLAGVQLDIDSPTAALPQYAGFLREIRKGLPEGCQISITALLDWFRNGTAIADVIRETDEFVPQFYDLADPGDYDGGTAIASRIDAAQWGPVFNRFRKRVRVGISTFGRARMTRGEGLPGVPYFRLAFGDLVPLDVAANPAFELQTARNPANELILTYRAKKKVRVGHRHFDQGDSIQFILSTPEVIRAAVDSVRRMGGNVVGAVFFRWPNGNEPLVMQPDEVLIAAGLAGPESKVRNRIRLVDGHCAAVECVDVYLEGADPFSPKPVRYKIRSSIEFEYFLPEKDMPVRMTGPSGLELSLPPYCGRGRLYLGRAVTASHSEFSVEEAP
jgi:hypothetical protein